MNLLYKSTRSNDVEVTASQAILKGLADDGGLLYRRVFRHWKQIWTPLQG